MRVFISLIVIIAIILFWTLILEDEISEMIERKFNKNKWYKGFWCGLIQFITWYFSVEIATLGTYDVVNSWFPYLMHLGEKF